MIKKISTWVFVQLYVSFAVIFLNKACLYDIAHKTGNHPLIIFHSSRWMRVWWLALALIGVWLIFSWPLLNFYMSAGHITSYSVITSQDNIIFFGKYSMHLVYYWIIVVATGKILLALEIVFNNKMEYFRRFINKTNIIQRCAQKQKILPS